MLDTIRLRLYGILDTKDDVLSEIQRENGISNFVVPEHYELYKKIVNYRRSSFDIEKGREFSRFNGSNFSMKISYNRETGSYQELTNEEDFLKFKNSKRLNKHWQTRQMTRYVDEDVEKEINQGIYGKYRLRSSSPNVIFSINENGSFMDFEFSIPKYLYGHNLAEFIPQQGHQLRFYEGTKMFSFDTQKKYLFERLEYVIEKFFSDLCAFFSIDMLPNMDYVEVRRLDLCYNQYFPSKEDAFLYLNEQRKLDMKRQRKNSNIAKSYDTAISYHTSAGAYFKIYHKGSEYSKSDGDLKKHLELNQNYVNKMKMPGKHAEIYKQHYNQIWKLFTAKGKGEKFYLSDEEIKKMDKTIKGVQKAMPYKIPFLKKEMDKVLRYEVSLSSKFFTSCYKRKVFRTGSRKYKRKGCPHHRRAVEIYKKVKNAEDSRTKKRKITFEDRKLKKHMHEWYNRSVRMLLTKNGLLASYEKRGAINFETTGQKYRIKRFPWKHTILANKDVGIFSNYFLMRCVDHFKELIDYYQIERIKPYDEIMTRIKAYNEKALHKIEEFNAMNEIMIYDGYETIKDHYGNEKIVRKHKRKPNGQKITKATQLLKQSQLRKEGMKTVNTNMLAMYIQKLQNGQSLDEIFRELQTKPATKSRIKQDLKRFGVFEQTLSTEIDINVRTDFFQYYWNTDGEFYRQNFYQDQKHFNYGQIKNLQRFSLAV